MPFPAVSPATDDKIIGIAIAMGISGGLMLICGCLGLARKIRQKKEAEKAGKRGKTK